MSFQKDNSFEERVARAAEAKQKALDKLRNRPPVDEKVAAERQAARLKREAADAEKRAAKKKEREEAAEQAKAAKAAAQAPVKSEAELKAARDARYAARKARK